MRVVPHPPGWAELVFHVLAHVPAPELPSSLFSPWYVQFSERALGPASARALGMDVRALAAHLRDHAQLAAVQAVAWLWRESSDAAACAASELGALRAEQVADPRLLNLLLEHAEVVEGLRCAALLELDAFAGLPPVHCAHEPLYAALGALVPCAPGLAGAEISSVRPLTVHGRLWGDAIWIGAPGAGVTLEHASLQAAHEASVREVRSQARALSERQVEAVALVLLAVRIAGSEHARAHQAWCDRWLVRREHLEVARLSPEQRAVLEACLRG